MTFAEWVAMNQGFYDGTPVVRWFGDPANISFARSAYDAGKRASETAKVEGGVARPAEPAPAPLAKAAPAEHTTVTRSPRQMAREWLEAGRAAGVVEAFIIRTAAGGGTIWWADGSHTKSFPASLLDVMVLLKGRGVEPPPRQA